MDINNHYETLNMPSCKYEDRNLNARYEEEWHELLCQIKRMVDSTFDIKELNKLDEVGLEVSLTYVKRYGKY